MSQQERESATLSILSIVVLSYLQSIVWWQTKMTHWTDYSLRGWLSFLAFMHMGLALRSYLDVNFLYGKVYVLACRHSYPNYEQREPYFVRLFALYSAGQSFILLQSAIHLYAKPVQMVAIVMLFIFIIIVSLESFVFETIDFYGGTLLPFAMSVVSFAFMLVFHFIWRPWDEPPLSDEAALKMLHFEGKKKAKYQQAAIALARSRMPRSGRHKLNKEELYFMEKELMANKKMQ